MHSAFCGGDAVGITVNALVIPGVPLQGDVEFLVFGIFTFFVVRNFGEKCFFRNIEMAHEIDDAAFVLESDALFFVDALVVKNDFDSLVEKCHRLQTFKHCTCHELCAFCFKYGGVWPELDGCSGLATTRWGVTRHR